MKNYNRSFSSRACSLLSGLMISGLGCIHAPVFAQDAASNLPNLSPITLASGVRLAQSLPNPTIIPTDATPTRIGEERQLLEPDWQFYLMQKLPPRMWFSAVTEVSQRFESNVLFTRDNPQRDYVFRTLPNVTIGYDIRPNTSFYWNYFMIKDVFARNQHSFLTGPTFQSLSGGLRHQIAIGAKSSLQLDYQIRQLWQAQNLRQADMLPGLTYTHVFKPTLIGFANTQLQLRSRNIFATGTFREIDPFYTVGLLARKGQWNFVASNTFVTNFRNKNAIPPQKNFAMISDFEINRPLSSKFPALVGFIRAEPIWNWQSNGFPGLSGFDFRLFGGIRGSLTKPSQYAQMERLKKQLQQSSNSGINNGFEPEPSTGQNSPLTENPHNSHSDLEQDPTQEPVNSISSKPLLSPSGVDSARNL